MVIALSIVICVCRSLFLNFVTIVLASHQGSTLPSVYMATGFGPFDLPTHGHTGRGGTTPFPWSLANFVSSDIVLTSVELRSAIYPGTHQLTCHCYFVGVYNQAYYILVVPILLQP